MLVNFKPGQETFDLYYQVDGKLISWQELDPEHVEKIRLQLLPQAPAVARAVNENYEAANVPVISYAMLQLETATMAWFGRKLTRNPDSSNRQRYCFSLFRSSIEVLLTELNKQKKRVTSFLFMSIYSFSLT